MEAKEEIRARINIEDVIGEYIHLKRAGRNFKGLSPFSNEKTPSFMVSPDKHIWHDFSSNKGGDIFSFVMEVEGLDFRGALELLARKAGVDLSLYQTKSDAGLSKKKERLYQTLELATKFYQQNLVAQQSALEYVFKKRGLSKTVVQAFRIGYAPAQGDNLVRILQKRGFSDKELREAGLATLRRAGLGDMFRARMMVPLSDAQGRVVGFTARLTEETAQAPKYINTPQTLLYDKGRQVFGLHLAKEAIRKSGYVVVVEGNMDVVASHQADVRQAVATAGTAMTDHHLRSLARLTPDIRLSFDRDAAGIAATERAIGIASVLGLQLSIITLPGDSKDPDELIQHDPAAWLKAIEQPQDAIEWLLDKYEQRYDLSTAEGKRRTTSKVLEVLAKISDPVAQEHYLHLVARRTNTSPRAVTAKLAQLHQPSSVRPLKPTKARTSEVKPDQQLYQDHLLALTWVYPQLRDSLLKLKSEDFTGDLRQTIAQLIKAMGAQLPGSSWEPSLQSDELRVKIKELELIVEQKYADYDDRLYFVVSELSKRVVIDRKTKQKDALAKAIGEMQESDPRRQAANQQHKQLIKEIEALKH